MRSRIKFPSLLSVLLFHYYMSIEVSKPRIKENKTVNKNGRLQINLSEGPLKLVRAPRKWGGTGHGEEMKGWQRDVEGMERKLMGRRLGKRC